MPGRGLQRRGHTSGLGGWGGGGGGVPISLPNLLFLWKQFPSPRRLDPARGNVFLVSEKSPAELEAAIFIGDTKRLPQKCLGEGAKMLSLPELFQNELIPPHPKL